MCTVSMVADHYREKYERQWPQWTIDLPPPTNILSTVSRAEFDALKNDVEEMKKLLKRAAEYDAHNNEPNCEMDEKVALLKQIAKLVGVDLSDVFPATA